MEKTIGVSLWKPNNLHTSLEVIRPRMARRSSGILLTSRIEPHKPDCVADSISYAWDGTSFLVCFIHSKDKTIFIKSS